MLLFDHKSHKNFFESSLHHLVFRPKSFDLRDGSVCLFTSVDRYIFFYCNVLGCMCNWRSASLGTSRSRSHSFRLDFVQ